MSQSKAAFSAGTKKNTEKIIQPPKGKLKIQARSYCHNLQFYEEMLHRLDSDQSQNSWFLLQSLEQKRWTFTANPCSKLETELAHPNFIYTSRLGD